MSAVSFLAPLALLGLLALPALWWLLRATPPQPATTPFPPLRLLEKLTNAEETPVKTPWWLLALRLLLLTLLILAFAGPVWRASDPIALPGANDTPLLIVMQSDWATASAWDVRQDQATRLIEAASAEGRPVAITAFPQPLALTPLPGDRADALAMLANIAPQPVATDSSALRAHIETVLANPGWRDASLVWLTNGWAPDDDTQAWLTSLASERPIALVSGQTPDLALSLDGGVDGPAAIVTAVTTEEPVADPRSVAALDGSGRQLALVALTDDDGNLRNRVAFDLPLDLRNDIARIAIVPTRHTGEVVLVDDRLERRRVGIVGAERRDEAQPLLSGTTYVERALRPTADVVVPRSGDTSGEIDTMIAQGVDVIVLVDVASLIPSTVSLLEPWIEEGGVLIRFASTGLTQSNDDLIPVPLRAVDRQLGGALTWEEPQSIAPFAAGSPFAGLFIPQDVAIERQVLSEPGAALAARTYAELADSTPLVTGEARGTGQLVLFHVTADTGWSNLPLSGLFVDMLGRLVELAPTRSDAGAGLAPSDESLLAPRTTLDAFGTLGSPPQHAEPWTASTGSSAPSVTNPPGFYGPAASPRALNLFAEPPTLTLANADLAAQLGAEPLEIGADQSISLRPALVTLVALLALADAVIVLVLSGALGGLAGSRRAGTAASIAVLAAGLVFSGQLAPTSALAQSNSAEQSQISRMIAAANSTRLAYVVTGDRQIDQRSREGLSGLSRILTQRTAFEPGDPMAIDPADDELAFYPLIYWPMPETPIAVSDRLITRIDAYMNNGGTILFDTRDEASNFATSSISAQTANLRTLLAALDIPPLEPVPDDHVLTKSFYLLDSFPGRYATGPLWVEALPDDPANVDRPARGGDGVSPIMITGNDMASAWALSSDGRPLYATSPPNRLQREFAYRTGINIGMYVMTGNYKADQVHIPALLERLVQ
ncbi:MAG: DUF4159 domain-containing protein [Rhizobiales bacterium]|nr:DUF4159 domain-containing protein [Hyphomicrobiales bacterium]MBO6697389.1 DUF4159 domain-containing protein [Hyphomicrobiales bacterium]MBO6736356.1 DUF4159 domain-containing protein [Hyphomicrobiales bacterium]MBO6912826.1 DUF4159 domain-containing protein [Hyphomicrobiales bacterium]MBO6953994.1 DUF4159 domain-containing protein [Hyphomicrobiales bacterium]